MNLNFKWIMNLNPILHLLDCLQMIKPTLGCSSLLLSMHEQLYRIGSFFHYVSLGESELRLPGCSTKMYLLGHLACPNNFENRVP